MNRLQAVIAAASARHTFSLDDTVEIEHVQRENELCYVKLTYTTDQAKASYATIEAHPCFKVAKKMRSLIKNTPPEEHEIFGLRYIRLLSGLHAARTSSKFVEKFR